jgi:hypothetical protein
MKINLNITYSAEAQGGETSADEEAALNKLAPLVERYGQEIINAAMAEGLSVAINRS